MAKQKLNKTEPFQARGGLPKCCNETRLKQSKTRENKTVCNFGCPKGSKTYKKQLPETKQNNFKQASISRQGGRSNGSGSNAARNKTKQFETSKRFTPGGGVGPRPYGQKQKKTKKKRSLTISPGTFRGPSPQGVGIYDKVDNCNSVEGMNFASKKIETMLH